MLNISLLPMLIIICSLMYLYVKLDKCLKEYDVSEAKKADVTNIEKRLKHYSYIVLVIMTSLIAYIFYFTCFK